MMNDLEKRGIEALERARDLLAKAKDPVDPDEDFEEYDEPDLPEELEKTHDVDEEDRDDEGELEPVLDDGEDDEDEDEEDEVKAKPMAKAVAKAVDATPILAAIEKRLRSQEALLEALQKEVQVLRKALGYTVQGLEGMVKAYGDVMNAPRKPKAHSAVVPTAAPALDAKQILAKAVGVVKDPYRIALMEHYANAGDVERVIAHLLPDERAKVLGGEY